MNDEMLSQEEINELLKSVGGSEEDEIEETSNEQTEVNTTRNTVDINQYLDPMEQDALGEIGNISFGSAATALSQLLNQKVSITAPVVSLIEQKYLEEEFPYPYISIHVEYTEGVEGTNLLAIQMKDAAIIADLMLGGDGSNPAEELSDLHLSAVQEAMNQMMGSASTSMSTVFNKRVDISPPGIDVMDVKEKEGIDNIPGDEFLVKNSFQLRIGSLINSTIMQIFTIPFAKQMVYELMHPTPEETQESEEIITEEQLSTHHSSQQEQRESQESASQSPSESVSEMSLNDAQRPLNDTNSKKQPSHVEPAAFSSFEKPSLSESESRNLSMLFDIPLEVTVELGRTSHSIKDILEFSPGSIIELDKLAGEPVDILINQKLTARGEVVVIDENFGVRITDIVSQADRLRKLR